MEKFAVKRDPRVKKLRDFRKRGHCSCNMCKGYKDDLQREAHTERRMVERAAMKAARLRDTD